MALEDIEYVNYTLNTPDTQWEIWDKVNADFSIFYTALTALESEMINLETVDGGDIT